MIGLIVGFILSWLLLKLTKAGKVTDLFSGSVRSNLYWLLGALACGFLLHGAFQLVKSWLMGSSLALNPELTAGLFGVGVWFQVKSVFFEELLFRGALLILAVRYLGPRWALALSACAFGIYHWFTTGTLGHLVPMIAIFLSTGITGLVWAYLFWKTGSMAAPIGLHFGWNLIGSVVFPYGPLGPIILVSMDGQPLSGGAWIGLTLLQLISMALVAKALLGIVPRPDRREP